VYRKAPDIGIGGDVRQLFEDERAVVQEALQMLVPSALPEQVAASE
jgi:hypothetical protein